LLRAVMSRVVDRRNGFGTSGGYGSVTLRSGLAADTTPRAVRLDRYKQDQNQNQNPTDEMGMRGIGWLGWLVSVGHNAMPTGKTRGLWGQAHSSAD
jgi:hypothetical protein